MKFLGLEGIVAALVQSGVVIVFTVILWVLGRFLITVLTRRIIAGYGLLHRAVAHKRQAQREKSGQETERAIAPRTGEQEQRRRAQRARTVASLLKSILNVVLVIMAVLMVLDAFGINVGPLLATAGLAGVIIGFGAQQLVRDYLAGIFIAIEDQYGIGDVIESSGITGVVTQMGLRVTQVVDEHGTIWYMRNGDILQLGNHSQGRAHEASVHTGGPQVPATHTDSQNREGESGGAPS